MIKGCGLGVGYILTESGPLVSLSSLDHGNSVIEKSFRNTSSLMYFKCIVLKL